MGDGSLGGVGIYLALCRALRFRRQEEHKKMCAEGRQERVVQNLIELEFPFTCQEFGLFRTYAIPSISKLLAQTRKFEKTVQKRYDDTVLILSEATEQGLGSDRAELGLRRLNAIHAQFGAQISNADMLYTLSVFVVEPVRWVDAFEWRRCLPCEREATAMWWGDVGAMMGIEGIPSDWEGFARVHDEHEARHMVYSADNVAIAGYTFKLLLSPFPSPLRPFIERCSHCLMDPPLLRAMGYPDPPPLLVAAVRGALRLRALVLRHLSPPRPAALAVRKTDDVVGGGGVHRCRYWKYGETYPEGYRIDTLGDLAPGRVGPALDRSRLRTAACPAGGGGGSG